MLSMLRFRGSLDWYPNLARSASAAAWSTEPFRLLAEAVESRRVKLSMMA